MSECILYEETNRFMSNSERYANAFISDRISNNLEDYKPTPVKIIDHEIIENKSENKSNNLFRCKDCKNILFERGYIRCKPCNLKTKIKLVENCNNYSNCLNKISKEYKKTTGLCFKCNNKLKK